MTVKACTAETVNAGSRDCSWQTTRYWEMMPLGDPAPSNSAKRNAHRWREPGALAGLGVGPPESAQTTTDCPRSPWRYGLGPSTRSACKAAACPPRRKLQGPCRPSEHEGLLSRARGTPAGTRGRQSATAAHLGAGSETGGEAAARKSLPPAPASHRPLPGSWRRADRRAARRPGAVALRKRSFLYTGLISKRATTSIDPLFSCYLSDAFLRSKLHECKPTLNLQTF